MSTSSKSKSEAKIDRSSVRKNDNGSKSSKSSNSLPNKNSSSKTDRKLTVDLSNATIKTQPGPKVMDSDSRNSQKQSVSEKGILKNKKSARTGEQTKKKEKVKKAKPRKKTCYEKFAQGMGFYVGNVILKDPRAIEAAQALDLHQNHLRRLRLKFDKIDIDNSGNIDYDEFFESVGETRSPFTDKLFSLIGEFCFRLVSLSFKLNTTLTSDLDGSGTIEFDEYVRVMATYCMFTKDEILRFCFECFDVDRSGTIDEKEFVELCK